MYHYSACGLDNIYLKNGYQQKETPSGATTAIHDMDGLHKAIAKGLVAKEACLTPKEFRFLRGELDLSQKMLGVLFDKTDQMIAKWEKAETKIPLLADKAIRDLYGKHWRRRYCPPAGKTRATGS
jgi:putative transcriptional regulator